MVVIKILEIMQNQIG